jgi:cell division protein FtsA
MQEGSTYAVGIDIGTTTVRAVVGHIDATSGVPTIVGVGQAPNTGMRKGTVVNLNGPAQAIDDALGEAERMSGYQVNEATISIIVAGVAAARAVLSEQQIENGVALIDLGGNTTNVAIYEEGDLQYAAVIPIGGVNITNDLAIGLKTDPEVAEKVKLEHASAVPRAEKSGISIKSGGETYSFQTDEIDEIVEARLEEIFEAVQHELKKAGRAGKLPAGVVLTGASAQLKGITDYARNYLGLAVRIGKPNGFGGVAEDIENPKFATAIGLMLLDSESTTPTHHGKASDSFKSATGFLSKLFKRSK